MSLTHRLHLLATFLPPLLGLLTLAPRAAADDWLSWRGPHQTGVSDETDLPDRVEIPSGPPSARGGPWTFELAGRGTPVVDGDRLYGLGYEGTGKELQEKLFCLDAGTGALLWERHFPDFLSDITYHRFSIGSPTVDPETRNVFHISTSGLLSSFSPDGELLWQRSLYAEYGRSTYPNGRTGAPLIDGERVIVHSPTSSWGAHVPTRDRVYAFDKRTGENIWSCTPGGPPKDASFSFPVLSDEGGRRYLYVGLAGGHLSKVDARTGDAIWKYQMCIGGMSSSPLLYEGAVIATHGKENLDSSTLGRMISLTTEGVPTENWRNDEISAFTSSPVLVGDRVYQTTQKGELASIDAATGRTLWKEKLSVDQLHASPAYADGKLYIPMNEHEFFIVRPSDDGPEVLQKLELEGNCLGAPAIANGRIYVHTTARLYAFGEMKEPRSAGEAPRTTDEPVAGEPTRLQVVPGDFLVQQGDRIPFRARALDDDHRVTNDRVEDVSWTGLPESGVRIENGFLEVDADAAPGAFTLEAAGEGVEGTSRVRIVRRIPFTEDFTPPGPLGHWTRVRSKWELFDLDGEPVLAKPLKNPLFQRSMSQIGHPSASDYTMTVDIRSDGNRRIMSTGGVVNQRYLILLKGNHQKLEVSSNMELLRESVQFRWKAKKWYRLKTRVDVAEDGSGVVRAKCWLRDEPEPDAWTIEVEHANAHRSGAPGIYGFVPQSRFRVYLDNLSVIPTS